MIGLEQIEREIPVSSIVDNNLLLNVKRGDGNAVERLMTKYENIVQKKANTYFLIGSEREDVIQEGLIGLYKAICDYNKDKRASFRSFAELCITRQIISSIKAATRQKHGPLNAYISFYKPVVEGESERILLETIEDIGNEDPSEMLEKKEQYEHIQCKIMKTLTMLERDVLYHYLQGLTYDEIAVQVGRHEKAIDNALQRIKRKVAVLIKEKELEWIEL